MYLKFKNKNLISLQERFIICLTVLQHSIYSWSILLATETWGAGREALDIKKQKTPPYIVSQSNIQSCCENQIIHLEKDPWMILVPDILFGEGQGGWLGNKGKGTVKKKKKIRSYRIISIIYASLHFLKYFNIANLVNILLKITILTDIELEITLVTIVTRTILLHR